MTTFSAGLGATSGDALVTQKPAVASGNVWYVSSVTGANAASPRGLNRLAPLATLRYTIDTLFPLSGADGDIIVLMDGHTETIDTSALAIDYNVTIVGEGTSTVSGVTRPTVSITNNQTNTAMFNITGGASTEFNVEIRNIYFPTNSTASNVARITMTPTTTPAAFRMDGCYFDCNVNDEASAVSFNADAVTMRNNRFVSTADSIANRPRNACSLAAAPTVVMMDGDVFDNGSYGFDANYTVDMDTNAPIQFSAIGIGLLRGADLRVTSTNSYYVTTPNATGSVRVGT